MKEKANLDPKKSNSYSDNVNKLKKYLNAKNKDQLYLYSDTDSDEETFGSGSNSNMYGFAKASDLVSKKLSG